MRKKPKGSALLWAVCALLIVVLLMSGLLAVNKSYVDTEINNIAARRAEYFARSGIEVTAAAIADGNLTPHGVNIKDYVKDDGYLVVHLDCGDVRVEKAGEKYLRLVSEAEIAENKRTVTALMELDARINKWVLKGYATN